MEILNDLWYFPQFLLHQKIIFLHWFWVLNQFHSCYWMFIYLFISCEICGRRASHTNEYSGRRSSSRSQKSLWEPFLWLLWEEGHHSFHIANNYTLSIDKSGHKQSPGGEKKKKKKYMLIHIWLCEKKSRRKSKREKTRKRHILYDTMKERYARFTSRQERSLMPRKKKLFSPHTCGSKADKVVMLWWRARSSSSSRVVGWLCFTRWGYWKEDCISVSFPAKSALWREHKCLHFCCCCWE